MAIAHVGTVDSRPANKTSTFYAPATTTTLSKRIALSIFVLSVIAGAFLRFHQIGQFGFWTDELNHVMAADSYLKDGSLSVPTKSQYVRSKPTTLITALSFKYFGESETTARLPFAAVNVAMIAVLFVLVSRLFSVEIAAVSSFLLAFSPFAIEISRECRMYTIFQLIYFLMSIALLAGMENLDRNLQERSASGHRSSAAINPWFLILTVVLFAFGHDVHELTMNVGITLAAYAVAIVIYDSAVRGPRASLRSKYFWMLVAFAVVGLWFLKFRQDFVHRMINRATRLQDWQEMNRNDPGYYRYFFLNNFPGLVFIFPFGAYALSKSHGRKGFFIVMSFLPLMLCHTFLFARKLDRYVFYIYPFFLITVASGIVALSQWIINGFRDSQRNSSWRQWALAGVLLLPAINLVTYPWFNDSLHGETHSRYPDWKSVSDSLGGIVRGAEVTTLNYKEVAYYFHKTPEHYRIAEIRKTETYEPGLFHDFTEFKSGLERPNTIFIADRALFNNHSFLTDEMRDYVLSHMKEIPHAGEPRILVYQSNATTLNRDRVSERKQS